MNFGDVKEMRGLIADNEEVENCQPGHNLRNLRKCASKHNYQAIGHTGNLEGPEMFIVEMD